MNAQVRQAVESLYSDICTVYIKEPYKDPETKVSKFREKVMLEDEPCRLSYSNIAAAGQGMVATILQDIKLFIAPELIIPPGSRIVITRQGRTVDYARSGEPAVYFSHQEIPLELWKEYA